MSENTQTDTQWTDCSTGTLKWSVTTPASTVTRTRKETKRQESESSMSVLRIVGPKCTWHAAPGWITVSMPMGQTDGRTDGWTPDSYMALSVRRGQSNNGETRKNESEIKTKQAVECLTNARSRASWCSWAKFRRTRLAFGPGRLDWTAWWGSPSCWSATARRAATCSSEPGCRTGWSGRRSSPGTHSRRPPCRWRRRQSAHLVSAWTARTLVVIATIHMYTVSQKTIHFTSDHSLRQCRSIFKIFSVADFPGKSLCNYCRAFHLNLTVLLHYLAKFKKK